MMGLPSRRRDRRLRTDDENEVSGMVENYGQIVQVIGPSVDIRFAADKLPAILNAIRIDEPDRNIHLTLEVAQHVGNNTVRCIALDSSEGLTRGMKALDTGAPITVPVG